MNTSIAENTGGPKRPPVAPNINPLSTVFLTLTVPPRRDPGSVPTRVDRLRSQKRDLGHQLSDVQRRLGQSPTGDVTASTATSTTGDNYGNTYANASQEPWVQEGQFYCYVVAGAAGTAIVVIVAAPAVLAGAENATMYVVSTPYGAQVFLSANAAATCLALNPQVGLDGIEGAMVVMQAVHDNPDNPLGGIDQAGKGLLIIYGPGTLQQAQAVRGLNGAQNINFKQANLKICASNATAKLVEPSKVHGNTAGKQPATLYEKYDKDDNFLKHGISKDPSKRYTQKQLDDGYLIRKQTGPRDEMLKIERDLVERIPGPHNREPWAGRRRGQ